MTLGGACDGSQWDLDPYVHVEGWVCLAAVAYDGVGNRGVSAPLRVCIDFDPEDSEQPGCATGAVPPPECTDGCTRQPELSWEEQLLEQF